MFVFFVFVATLSFKTRPGSFQVAVESIYEGIVGLIDQITNNTNRSQKIFPVIGAMLVYLAIANLIGLIPGIESLTFNDTPLFKTPTADFNTTFGLALGAIIVINGISIMEWGPFGFAGRFVPLHKIYYGFKKGIGAGFMSIIDLLLGLLDIIGELAKIISLSLRLFGNMYAGQVLSVILLGAFAYIIPSIWLAMNLFVGILQAMVFASLVAAYYMLAINPAKNNS
ncbi:MAG: F0F1 ATP synthase subunit A [Candidatus Pacebacteria bacterium]|nr:F0F1 ATP synthase subunit A [Candidatus Paceibacterota bacterium]